MNFTDEQRQAFSNLVLAKMRERGWTRQTVAELAGVNSDLTGTLTRTMPDGMRVIPWIKVMLVLDIDIYEAIRILGLDAHVRELRDRPEFKDSFPNSHLWDK